MIKRITALMVTIGALVSAPVNAQTPPAPAPPAPPVVKESDPNKPLSDKLKENEGVLTPNLGLDKEMQVKPPPTSSQMPVIPPPGEPGGDPKIQPK